MRLMGYILLSREEKFRYDRINELLKPEHIKGLAMGTYHIAKNPCCKADRKVKDDRTNS